MKVPQEEQCQRRRTMPKTKNNAKDEEQFPEGTAGRTMPKTKNISRLANK
jgi:hypothetical protein